MPEPREWCRIVQVDGVVVLFYQDFDSDDDLFQIHAIVKTDGMDMDCKVGKKTEFTSNQFDAFASEKTARSVIKQAGEFGFQPQPSPPIAIPDRFLAALREKLHWYDGVDFVRMADLEAAVNEASAEVKHA